VVKPLSDDAQVILALVKKYPGIEAKHISRELGITIKRVIKGAMELYENGLIRSESTFLRETAYSDWYEVVKFYAKY
jgi:predicted transcriptional regulator